MTLAEEKLWDNFLKNHKYRFRRQKQIENYIVDFYCSKFMLVIEIDGEVHNEENRIQYDMERTHLFESYGIKVIRFRNEDVINTFEDTCKRISEYVI